VPGYVATSRFPPTTVRTTTGRSSKCGALSFQVCSCCECSWAVLERAMLDDLDDWRQSKIAKPGYFIAADRALDTL
jgi:hypothetical protein